MDYSEILSKAWKIIWKYKVLWIFGFFASCSSGSGNSSNFRSSSSNGRGFGSLPPEVERALEWLITPTGIAVIISVFLLLTLISLALGSIGIIGLQKGTRLGDQAAERITFSELWAASTPYFKRVFGMNILLFFIGLILALVLFVPIFFLVVQNNFDPGSVMSMVALIFLCVCCLIVPLSLLMGIFTNMWVSAMVLEEMSFADGLVRGWNVFKGNFWKLIGLALILFLISLAVGLVMAIPLFAIMVPVMIAAQSARSDMSAILFPLLCLLALSPILWLLRAVLTGYMQAAWTLTFLRLTAPAPDQNVPLPAEVAEA